MKKHLNNAELSRDVGLFSAIILVIANMVGTGIFTTSGFIIKDVGNPVTMLACWVIGGVFALSGALCYSELGAMFPKAGGDYAFLRESFGKSTAFLSGWISLIVGFSAPIAAAAIAFAAYLFRLLSIDPGNGITLRLSSVTICSMSPVTLCATCIIVIISMLHFHSISLGTRVQNVLTAFKITLILVFITAGLLWGRGSIDHFSAMPGLGQMFKGNVAVSLIFISFAYSGWNAAAYLGAEIKNPGRNIPVALIAGTLTVICLYLLLNMIYIFALPQEAMEGKLEVGALAAAALFGQGIGRYFTGAIALGLLSVLSAMIMAGPRVYYAMAKDSVFFTLFGKVNALHHTPAYAIILQAVIAILMVFAMAFDTLLLYIGFTLSLCATLTVIGMMKLRLTNPERVREYTTFGYPVTPLLFIIGNLWIIYFSITSRPVTSVYGIATIVLGYLLYRWFNAKHSGTT